MQPLRRGAVGVAVADVRRILAALGYLENSHPRAQQDYDEATELAIRHFQQNRGMSVDGVVGRETYTALIEAHWRLGDRVLAHEPGQMFIGDDVRSLQTQLLELGYDVARADGVFGARTADGLRNFQRDYGLVADGVCGPATLRALRQLARRVVGGRPQLLREMVAVAAAGPSLLGKRIVIDPAHGGDDPGTVHADDEHGQLSEAQLNWDLAARLEGRLTALGVSTWLTRGPHNGRTEQDRARLANDVGADLVISLHVDGFSSPRANGLAVYYFGAAESSSTIGERLAGLVQRELVARTGMTDGRIHAKTWPLLRLTRMPAVRLELGYLTSPLDRARLSDPLFRDTVAEGVLVAVQRLYLPQSDDPPTGVLRIPANA
jgi:N-acetylmuramoyl-L-alanine amidase